LPNSVDRLTPRAGAPDEPPPLLGSWRRVYLAVTLYLCGFIALLAWFTWGFQR